MICSDAIQRASEEIRNTETVLIGAGAGMSASSGLDFSKGSEMFREHFGDFADKYGIEDMYTGGFYPFPTPEEYWAWWSRVVWLSRYTEETGQAYRDLYEIVKDKDYFVLTTNVDGQFERAGFNMDRVFPVQGDFALLQCTIPCTNQTYDNREIVREMYERQRDMRIPSELIPKCPVCGAPLTMNLRIDDSFVEDVEWDRAAEAYTCFLRSHKDEPKVLLDIGVGFNTPGIIKYTFWRMTDESSLTFYILINPHDIQYPQEIAARTVAICKDAGAALAQIRECISEQK